MSHTFEFYLPDVYCQTCMESIENRWKRIQEREPAITQVTITPNLLRNTVQVIATSHCKEEEVKKKFIDDVESIGQRCFEEIKPPIVWQHWVKGAVGILVGAGLLAFSLLTGGIPLAAMIALGAVSTLLSLYLGKESLLVAFQKAKEKTITMDTLFSISSLMAIGVSIAAFMVPGWPFMPLAALFIFGFRHLGKGIEEDTKLTIVNTTFSARARRQIRVEGSREDVQLENVKPGQIIVVQAGHVIPLDGTLLSDNAALHDDIVTGEIDIKYPKKDAPVLAGMRVAPEGREVRILVTKNEAESYLAYLDKQVKQSDLAETKSKNKTFADKIMKYFVPVVIGVAIVAAIAAAIFVAPLAAVQCAAAILVSVCPCTFGLIMPLSGGIGVRKGMRYGVQFKDASVIEQAANIKKIAFDLNGTLTDESRLQVVSSTVPESLLPYFASLEATQQKKVASAISQFINKKGVLEAKSEIKNLDSSQHSGVSGVINDEAYLVGDESFMKAHQIAIPSEKVVDQPKLGQVIYFARGNKIEGHMVMECPLKPDASRVLNQCRQMGYDIYLVTGSAKEKAERYAKELGIPPKNIRANCDSKVKAEEIRKLGNEHVAMVGDAANDALALKASQFGIAIKSMISDRKTLQEASAVIHDASLQPIVSTFAIAKQTTRNMKQNMIFSLAYNSLALILFGVVLVAIGFAINPALGALLMVVQAGIIMMNCRRLQSQSLPSYQLSPTKSSTTNSLQTIGSETALQQGHCVKPNPVRYGSLHKKQPLTAPSVVSSNTAPQNSF